MQPKTCSRKCVCQFNSKTDGSSEEYYVRGSLLYRAHLQEKMSSHVKEINTAIAPYRKMLLQHPVYHQLRHLDDLKILMEQHVFAVWDFMALLKALQFGLTSTNAPWMPIGSPAQIIPSDTSPRIFPFLILKESYVLCR